MLSPLVPLALRSVPLPLPGSVSVLVASAPTAPWCSPLHTCGQQKGSQRRCQHFGAVSAAIVAGLGARMRCRSSCCALRASSVDDGATSTTSARGRPSASASASRRGEGEGEGDGEGDEEEMDPSEQLVYSLANLLKVTRSRARRINEVVHEWVVTNEGLDQWGTKTQGHLKTLCRGIPRHGDLRPLLLEDEEGNCGVMEALRQISIREARHLSLTKRQEIALLWGDSDVEGDQLRKPMPSMQLELLQTWWSRALPQRMLDQMDEYFLLTHHMARRGHPEWVVSSLPPGWKEVMPHKSVFEGEEPEMMYWNPQTRKLQRQVPEDFKVNAPPPRQAPVNLLDVGSAVNSFRRFDLLVRPVAIDLQPATDAEDTYQADFLDVPIRRRAADDASARCVVVDSEGKLASLVAGSFDVVVLSLVLSNVSDPVRRIEMVARARRCLRSDRGLMFVCELNNVLGGGVGRDPRLDVAMAWERNMEDVGFRCMRFTDAFTENHKMELLCQWVFETAPVRARDLSPLLLPREKAPRKTKQQATSGRPLEAQKKRPSWKDKFVRPGS
mmetsp:Transcript_82489/g.223963  ORF Transcript_82489/g.223963 Transcript_82489/m.223963 type:complete len:556 (-) Transcript_82489:82-1749(-)